MAVTPLQRVRRRLQWSAPTPLHCVCDLVEPERVEIGRRDSTANGGEMGFSQEQNPGMKRTGVTELEERTAG